MEFKDYYKILGVKKDATEKEIKSAYRKLARRYHPDVNKEKGASDRFKEINEAHTVLNDAEKRAKYDQLGSNWQAYERAGGFPGGGRRTVFTYGAPGGGQGGFDFSDFFETFFGEMMAGRQETGKGPFGDIFTRFGGAGARRPQPEIAPEQEAEIEVGLEEVAHGGERQINIEGKTATVTIPKGIKEGMKLRIPAVKSGAGADVLLVVRYRKHPVFGVEGEDVVCEIDVPVTRAVLGGEAEAPTLYGNVTVKIPPLTQGGRVMRLKNQGLPRWRSQERGDQLVKVRLVFPSDLTEREQDLYRELDRLRSKGG